MKIHLVLVRTLYPSNVGAAARALANMGGDRLILIDSRCELNSKAHQMAAGAQEALNSAIQYASWESFFASEGEGVRIGLTRRGGKNRKVTPLTEKVTELLPTIEHLYFILGPEDDGLDANDLSLVNFTCHLPTFGEFASLNLAQASLLAMFIARSAFPPEQLPVQHTGQASRSVQPLYFPDQLIKDWLTAMGFDVQARRASAFLTLRRLFLQNLPTRHEIQVLEAVLQQNIRKLKKLSSLGLPAEEVADDVGDVPV